MNELVVLTTYYNPFRYATRRANYKRFMEGMRAVGAPCITVECAFGNQAFELTAAIDVLQIRAQSLLWQKERLLNLACSWLPPEVKYVAWLDCDILFDNPDWKEDLVRVLKKHKVAQVFETCLALEKDERCGSNPDIVRSFASVVTEAPELLDKEQYANHGHTGYGWAMRREIFDEVGLYEGGIAGSADQFMAHAIFGKYGDSVRLALRDNPVHLAHLKAWGDRFYQFVQGRLGVVKGQIRHLWHGDIVNRRYFFRMHEVIELGYNPWTDLSILPGKPTEWAPTMQKNALKQYLADYFYSRQEDGTIAR